MNKFFQKSLRTINYGYRVSKSFIQPKELKICSSELDLSKENVTPEELTILICHQIDPSNIIKIYQKYKNQFSDRHLLQCLKITAKMQGMFYLPLYDEQFLQSFQSLLSQFNQYVVQLNNLDLADFVYWYKKVQNDVVLSNNCHVIDVNALLNAIQKNIDENLFLPRQMNMIYECIDQVFPEKEHLNVKLLENSFSTQDITPTQVLQFIQTLSKKFIMKKKLDLNGALLLLQYLSKLKESFDVDQNSSMIKPLMNMKLHLFITEKVFLQTILTRYNYTKLNLKYLESGTIGHILQYFRYQSDSIDPELFLMIHEQMMKRFSQPSEDQNIEFLISYLTNIYNSDWDLDEDLKTLEKSCLLTLSQYGEQTHLNQLAEYFTQKKELNQQLKDLILLKINQVTYFQIGQYIYCLLYLHYVCKINISQYLRTIYQNFQNNIQQAQETLLPKQVLINLIMLYDEYPHSQIPEGLEQQFGKMNYVTQLQAISTCSTFNDRVRKILVSRLHNIKNETRFDRRLWPVLITLIKTKEDAINLFKIFITNFRNVLQQIFHLVFITNEYENITIEQTYFFYYLFQDAIEELDIEILINGLVFNTEMLRKLIEINPTIMDVIFSQSYKYNEGQGTAILIQLLEISYKDLKQFRIHQQLIYNYKQLKEYDTNFILMMIKYNCYPLQDSNKIFHYLISFSSNELKLFILYLDMSSKLGFQKLQPHILKQIKKLNETYVIQIQ